MILRKQPSPYFSPYCGRIHRLSWLFIFVFLSQLIVNARYFWITPWMNTAVNIIASAFSALWWACLAVMLGAIPRHRPARVFVAGFLALAFALMILFEHYLMSAYGTAYTDTIALPLLSTNSGETGEFFTSAFAYRMFYAGILSLIITVLPAFLAYMYPWSPRYHRRIIRPVFLGLLLSGMCGIWVAEARSFRHGTPDYGLMSTPGRLIWGTSYCLQKDSRMRAAMIRFKHEGIYTAVDGRTLPCVVVIMGESLRRNDMHCYGYSLKNTPMLDSIAEAGDLTLFPDVISPAPNTAEAIPEVMTFHTLGDSAPWYHYPTLMTAFSGAGYFTYWLSNQEKTGFRVQPVADLAETSDSVCFVNSRHDSAAGGAFDGVLLSRLMFPDNPDLQHKRGLLEVIHLMGSHPDFKDRFPSSFSRFTASELPRKLPARKAVKIADYINSVYYNDYVVGHIFNAYSRVPAIVFYLSDHGFVLYDAPGDSERLGPGNNPAGLSIPFMVYMSPSFQKDFPDAAARVRAAKNLPAVSDVLTPSILDLCNIRTHYGRPDFNLFSSAYNVNRPRIIRGWGAISAF